MSADLKSLPIIDLSELDKEGDHEEFYKELRRKAKDIGFFYLVGHGISPKLREDLLAASKKFFALPQDEKDKIDMANSRHFRGYTRTGDEHTRNKPDYREMIDLGEELPAASESEIGDKLWLNLNGPNQFPDDRVPELRGLALEWLRLVRDTSVRLLRAFLRALEVPEHSLDDLVREPHSAMKLIHYPANPDDAQGGGAKKEQGVGPHKDHGLLTLLWQDGTGGLQVQTKTGEWIDAPPIENSFVINIGEMLELATNGYLIANVHQVKMASNRSDRYSIAYFVSPDVRASTIPQLPLAPELAAQAQGPSSDPLNPLFSDIGKNSIKGRLRSHPKVTERWYPEQFAALVAAGVNMGSAY